MIPPLSATFVRYALFLSGAWLSIALFPLSAGAENSPECASRYQQLARQSRQELDDRFSQKSEPNAVDRSRDWLKEQLEVLHGRAYPASTVNEATPLKADNFARAALGKPAEGQPFQLDALKSELAATLRRVESFSDTYKTYAEETAQNAIRLERMKELEAKVLKLTGSEARNLEFEMPFIKRTIYDEAGNFKDFEIGSRPERFSNRNQFLLELEGLKGSIAERMRTPLFGLGSEKKLIAQQAEDLNRLGIYLSAARSLQSRMPDAAMDPGAEALLTRIAKLYEGGGAPGAPLENGKHWFDIVPEKWNSQNKVTSLPHWAWREENWKEFWSEMRSIYEKEKAVSADALAFLNKLGPEERQALGYTNLAQSAGFFGSNKFLPLLLGGGGLTAGGGFGVWELSKEGFQYFLADSLAKEKCAELAKEDEFVGCMQNYLLEKFGGDPVIMRALQKGKLKELENAAVKEEVEDALRKRSRYRGSQAQKAAAGAAFGASVRGVLSLEDPTSQAFRQRLVSTPDNGVFLMGLLGSPGKPGLLPATYPNQFNANQDLVRAILREPDPQKRNAELTALRSSGAPDLADGIAKIYMERQNFFQQKSRVLISR
jgi:hypothetical protein